MGWYLESNIAVINEVALEIIEDTFNTVYSKIKVIFIILGTVDQRKEKTDDN